MKMKPVLMGIGVALALQAYAEYEWTLYDDFSSGALDASKWSLEVENSSTYPAVQSGRVKLDATLTDGSCKIGVKDAALVGVKADLSLGYADDGSGNEIEIGLSDGVELWLDIGMYGSIHYISAAAEDEFGEEVMGSYVTNAVYDQVYELAVVISNGTVRCYVDDVLLDQYEGEAGLRFSYCHIGAWSDVAADVEGTIDNVYVLREEDGATSDNSASAIVGSWLVEGDDVVITFLDDGTYFLAHDGTADEGGQPGMERGTYSWNTGSGAFSTTQSTDTCGDWGLSHTTSNDTLFINGNTLSLVIPGEGTVEFQRVVDASIAGGWFGGEGDVLITFFADGSYYLAHDGVADGGGQPGMERGTYSWNTNSGAFSTTQSTDTCGDWGLSHTTSNDTLSINGNTLSLVIPDEGTVEFQRVTAEWSIADVVDEIGVYAFYDLVTSEYGVELELETVEYDSLSGVHVAAPFGSFSCEQDWDDWEYELLVPMDSTLPEVDGDWVITVTNASGQTKTTTIAFEQADGSALPDVTTCPQLTVPDLTGSDPIFAMDDLTWKWDSAFDPNANLAVVGSWNELLDEDLELIFEPTASMRSNGPLSLEAGTTEAWFANAFMVEGTNADGIAYELFKYAGYDFEPTVVDREWDADLDHISNGWEYDYFGGLTNCNAQGDADGDGVSNYGEYQAGTNPTNAASRLEGSASVGPDGFEMSWAPVSGHEYRVLWTTNLTEGFTALSAGLTAPQSNYTDSAHSDAPVGFYRIGVARVSTNPAVVSSTEITIDGAGGDWEGIAPQFEDPAGDSSIYTGLDVTGITLARGASNLFVRIDRAGMDMPTNSAGSVWITLRSEVDGVAEYGINYYRDEAGDFSFVSLDENSNDTWSSLGSNWDGDLLLDDTAAGIEIAIPLSLLELVDHYALDCFSHHEEGGEWLDNGENWDNNTVAVIIFP